jgi:hypothetical protein
MNQISHETIVCVEFYVPMLQQNVNNVSGDKATTACWDRLDL